MISLSALYRQSWTGRGRRAYIESKSHLILNSDFLRWIFRMFQKEGPMVLQKQFDTDHFTVMIFKRDTIEKSMVRYVAETILALGDDPAGVPTEALHYCVPSHPFSSMQRLRELVAAYRREWTGMELEGWPKTRKTHTFKKNRYFFSKPFMAWLKCHIDEIEQVCYPVQTKKRLPIDIDKNKV
jgi:hypothetical protein